MRWYSKIPLYPWYIKIPVYVFVFFSVAGVSALTTFLIMSKFIKVEVPDLRGRSLPEAVDMLDNVGLSMKIEEEVHDIQVPAGHIIEQGTEAGTRVSGHLEIGVVLSKGPEVRLIPDVTGLALEEAEKILKEDGLVLDKVIMVHSRRVRKNKVIAQRPAPEEWTGETITLVASAGRRDVIYYTPFFTGMQKEDAKLLASELRLGVVITEGAGDTIVLQSPEPGTPIGIRNRVYLTPGE